MDLPLRAAMPSDLTYLVAIDAQSPGGGWNLASFARELELAWSNVVVVEGEIEGKEAPAVVGFVVFWRGVDEAEIMNVAVSPTVRRQGVGRRLVEHVVRSARSSGATRVLLEVRRSNAAAQGLYQALGFVETGVRPNYYQRENEDAILMELAL